MSTGRNTFTEPAIKEEGRQRKSNLEKVINMLPARSKDNFMLLLLLVMGLSGFAYILSVPVGTKANKRSLFDKIFNPTEGKALTADFIKSNLLNIEGEKKVNAPLVFSFSGLSEDHEYELNFGDKEFSTIDTERLTHIFKEPGTYKIEMKKISRGHTFVVHCEYLSIH